MIYTLTDDQAVEREGLLKAGFKEAAQFVNPSTHNRIRVFLLPTNQPRAARRFIAGDALAANRECL